MENIIKIIQYFSELSSKIKLNNALGLMDINIYCENDLLQILNNIYDWNLYNVNERYKNAKAIDLIDDKHRIAIQVTSNTTTNKIKETIDKFKETQFLDYELYMFYLTDDLPNNTKKALQKNNIKSLCFKDLIQKLHFNSVKAQEFITKITEKTIIEKFKDMLKNSQKWDFDNNLNVYYNNIDPNFRMKLDEHNEENERYKWLSEIMAISKRYKGAKLYFNCIRLFYNDIDLGIKTFSVDFYQEILTIAIPRNLYFDDKRDLYFDGYIIDDKNTMDIDSLLTYFFNFKSSKISYKQFVNQQKNLTYQKSSNCFIPLIFFKNY
ncbi:SMEK domain-containing protein, partial [Campylobacter sp.]|uniref:SMEK domain-containing protein n=1 Tax=Campylobacter sp. TaxID=205 RepID=UPI0025BE0597